MPPAWIQKLLKAAAFYPVTDPEQNVWAWAPAADQVWPHLSADAGGHLLQKKPLWSHGSSAAREGAEKAVAKDKPISAGTGHFFKD